MSQHKERTMANIRGVLKLKVVWFLLIPFGLLVIWFFYEEEMEEKLEPIKTKFPLSDYLFKNTKDLQDKESSSTRTSAHNFDATKKDIDNLIKRAESVPPKGYFYDKDGNLIDKNGHIIATYKAIAKLPDRKALEELIQRKNQTLVPKLPLLEKQKISSVSKYSFNSFDYSKADSLEKIRLTLLSQRLEKVESNGDSNTKDKQHPSEIDYGSSGFEGFKRKNVASNENRLLRTITADRMIPAILITPISSEIGGSKIVAQIESDIYATMGRAVLIPKGSRAIGYYNSNNKIGEYRLEVVWNRILTPQGVNIILSDAKGADVKGYNGLVGTLHNKYWERYGLPLSMSTLSNGLLIGITSTLANNMGRGKYLNTNPYFGDYMLMRLTQQTGQSINNIVQQILREQIRIKPIITIREGSRIFISPNTDIWFPIPKNGEVLAQFFKEEKSQDKEKP